MSPPFPATPPESQPGDSRSRARSPLAYDGVTIRTSMAKSRQRAPIWCRHWLYVMTKVVSLRKRSELYEEDSPGHEEELTFLSNGIMGPYGLEALKSRDLLQRRLCQYEMA